MSGYPAQMAEANAGDSGDMDLPSNLEDTGPFNGLLSDDYVIDRMIMEIGLAVRPPTVIAVISSLPQAEAMRTRREEMDDFATERGLKT